MFPWVIGISVGLVAVAFAVLVVYICITLSSLKRTLETSDRLLRDTRVVVDDLQVKIHAFDSLFRAISNVGGVVEKKVAHATDEIVEQEKGKMGIITDALEWAILGVTLWQKVKERK